MSVSPEPPQSPAAAPAPPPLSAGGEQRPRRLPPAPLPVLRFRSPPFPERLAAIGPRSPAGCEGREAAGESGAGRARGCRAMGGGRREPGGLRGCEGFTGAVPGPARPGAEAAMGEAERGRALSTAGTAPLSCPKNVCFFFSFLKLKPALDSAGTRLSRTQPRRPPGDDDFPVDGGCHLPVRRGGGAPRALPALYLSPEVGVCCMLLTRFLRFSSR